MKQRVHKFDTIKVIAMVMVIILHAYGMEMPALSMAKQVLIVDVLGVSMYLFSFISGWMMRPLRWNWFSIVKLIIVVAVMNSAIHFSRRVFGLVDSANYFMPAYTLWYMWVLLACKIFLPMFRRPSMALFVSIVICCGSSFFPLWMREDPIGRFVGFLPFFTLGYYVSNSNFASLIRDYIISDWHKVLWRAVLVLIICCASGILFTKFGRFFCAVLDNKYGAIGCDGIELCARIMVYVFVVGWVMAWIKSIPKVEMKISTYGARTLPVYLFHTLPIFACASFARLIPLDDVCKGARCFVMTIAICICLLLFNQKVFVAFGKIMNLKLFAGGEIKS